MRDGTTVLGCSTQSLRTYFFTMKFFKPKCRIWDDHNKVMHYLQPLQSIRLFQDGSGILLDADDNPICFFAPNLAIKKNRALWYIGAEDKECKEIYEGDIIRVYTHYAAKYGERPEETLADEYVDHVVKWCMDDEYPAFDLVPNLCPECNGISDMLCNQEYEFYEVIGNIYENPELIQLGED